MADPRDECLSVFRQLDAIFHVADAQGRPLTADEKARFDALFAHHEALTAQIEDKPMDVTNLTKRIRACDGRIASLFANGAARREDLPSEDQAQLAKLQEKFHELEDELLEAGGDMPDDLFATRSTGRRTEPSGATGRTTGGTTALPATPKGGNPRHFANLFPQAARGTDGWRDDREFFECVAKRMYDPRFKNALGGSEGVGEDGGFAVPPAFIGRLLDEALEMEIIRPRATVLPVGNSNIANVPAWDDLDHSAGTSAGLEGLWTAEGGTNTRQTAKIRPLSIRANKLSIYSTVTSELMSDGPMFMQRFRQKLIETIAWSMDFSLLRGDGVGKPLGVLNSPSLIAVSAESGQTADTVVYANLKKIYSRMHPRSRPNAVWIMHSDVLPFLLSMFASDGSTSSLYPILERGTSTDFAIYGRPVYFTEHAPQLGDQGDIGLYDLSKYLVVMRQTASVETSNAPSWLTDEQDFRCKLRVGGQSSWDKAFSPRAGASLSWAVTVAAR